MKTIWKFPLEITDFQKVSMPSGAQVLTAQLQNEQLTLWAVVDTEAKKEPTGFWIFGTGNPIEHEVRRGRYINTVQDRYGLVWHVFEHNFD